MEFRNPVYNAFGTIDCEINHPNFGWVPFTADPDDTDQRGRDIFEAAFALGPADYVAPPPQAPTTQQINAERARRLVLPFDFGGNSFDRDAQSLQRITGAATLAGFAIAAGAQPGDLYWHGGTDPFSWITATNTIVQMDAQTCFTFGQAAAAVETNLIFAARALKQADPIPADYMDDSHWA